MATLNITTAKTRAQMITALNSWAGATRVVTGNNYIWSCTDHINVSASVDISGFDLIFATGKRMYASAGGIINVSTVYLSTQSFPNVYIYPAKISLRGASNVDINLVSGTGKWLGRGLTIIIDSANIRFDSSTSETKLYDVTIDASVSAVTALKVLLHDDGELNLYRVTGLTVVRYGGKLTMNPKGDGLVSSQSGGAAKLVGINATFPGFVIVSDSTHRLQTASSAYNATTMTFIDGKVDPDFLDAYPANDDNVIRIIQKTFKISAAVGFSYRVSGNRWVQPAAVHTPDVTLFTKYDTNQNETYIATVWRGTRPTGSATYNPLRDIVLYDTITVQLRAYRYYEASLSYTSYFFEEIVRPTLIFNPYITLTTPTYSIRAASDLYDLIRRLIVLNFLIPEDLLVANGDVLTIKTGWKLARSTDPYYQETSVDVPNKTILVDQDVRIIQDTGGLVRFTTFDGTVDSSIFDYTNMNYPLPNGKANLTIQIICPPGSKNPVVGVWEFSKGKEIRTGMISGTFAGSGTITVNLAVDPATKYYCVVKAHGAEQYEPFPIYPIGRLGGKFDIQLSPFKNIDRTKVFPATFTPAQTAISNMFVYNGHGDNKVEFKLPTSYASNSRWDDTNKIWQFTLEDFIPIAWKFDELQSSIGFLLLPQVFFIADGSIIMGAGFSPKLLRQDTSNKVTAGSEIKVSFTKLSISQIGDVDKKNLFIDDSNGAIEVSSGAPISVSVTGTGLTPTERSTLNDTNTKVGNLKTETDKIPSIKTQTDKLTAIKAKTDLIVSGGGSGGLTPAQATQLTAVKTETDKIQSVKTQTDKITSVKTETDKIQSVKTETDKIQSVKTQTDKITSVKTETDKIPAIKTQTDKIPAIKAETDLIVPGFGGLTTAQSTQLSETHQRLALDSAKPLTNKPDGGFTSSGITVTGTSLPDGSTVQTRRSND